MRIENHRGFTLLEIMIATLLMAAAGAGIIAAFVQASNIIRPHRQSAFTTAENTLDSLYQQVDGATWGTGANGLNANSTGVISVDTETGTGAPAPTSMTVTKTVSNVTVAGPSGPVTKNYKKVMMTVQW